MRARDHHPRAPRASTRIGLLAVAGAAVLAAAALPTAVPVGAAASPAVVPTASAGGEPPGTFTVFAPTVYLPRGITTGPDGNIWYTNGLTNSGIGPNSIARITPTGTITTFTGDGVVNPSSITTGPDNNLWFVNAGEYNGPPPEPRSHVSLGRITPSGTVTNFADPSTMASLGGITAGPDGNLWVTANRAFTRGSGYTGVDAILRVTTSGVVTSFSAPDVVPDASIAAGADGNLWFANAGGIGRVTPDGTFSLFSDPSFTTVRGIAAGPDGNIWFAADGGTSGTTGEIGSITPDGTITPFAGADIAKPSAITAGPDGRLWFTNAGGAWIGRITPAGTTSRVAATPIAEGALTAGPDGRVWYADTRALVIGRIDTTGGIVRFRNNGVDGASGIVVGPDGGLWFTNTGVQNSIGRIATDGTSRSFPTLGIQGSSDIAGPDGNVWFITYRGITKVTPAGVVTVVSTQSAVALVAGTDGNIWFQTSDAIGRLTPDGTTTTMYTDPAFGGGVSSITAGPDGSIWFAYSKPAGSPCCDRAGLGRIAPDGVMTLHGGLNHPGNLIIDTHGDAWYTAGYTGVSKMTKDGTSTLVFPSAGTPFSQLLDHSGNVWFVLGGEVVRLAPDGTARAFGYPAGVPALKLLLGPDTKVWFTNWDAVGSIDAAGTIATIPAPGFGDLSGAQMPMAFGSDGNIWFTRNGNVERLTVGALPAGTVQGRAAESGTGRPLGGITVTAMAAWPGWVVAATTTTAADGTYNLRVPQGSYTLRFFDPTGAHPRTWYSNDPTYKSATPVAVGGSPIDVDQVLDVGVGTLAGRAVHGPSATDTRPVAGVRVRVFDEATHSYVAGAITGDDGYYQLTGLRPATYLVQFVDPQRRYLATWYAGALLPANATPAMLAAGSTTWASAWLGA